MLLLFCRPGPFRTQRVFNGKREGGRRRHTPGVMNNSLTTHDSAGDLTVRPLQMVRFVSERPRLSLK